MKKGSAQIEQVDFEYINMAPFITILLQVSLKPMVLFTTIGKEWGVKIHS